MASNQTNRRGFAATGGRSPAKGGQTGKLIFAAVLLLVAGGVFAWSQGWIMGEKPAAPVASEELNKQFEEQKKEVKRQTDTGKAAVSGSD